MRNEHIHAGTGSAYAVADSNDFGASWTKVGRGRPNGEGGFDHNGGGFDRLINKARPIENLASGSSGGCN